MENKERIVLKQWLTKNFILDNFFGVYNFKKNKELSWSLENNNEVILTFDNEKELHIKEFKSFIEFKEYFDSKKYLNFYN